MNNFEERIQLINFEQEDNLLMEVLRLALEGLELNQTYIQRRLRVGYVRAGRLLERLVECGILRIENVVVELKFETEEIQDTYAKVVYKIIKD